MLSNDIVQHNFSYGHEDNIINKMDRDFLNLCSIMENNNSLNPSKYTIFQFYSKIDYLNKQVNNTK